MLSEAAKHESCALWDRIAAELGTLFPVRTKVCSQPDTSDINKTGVFGHEALQLVNELLFQPGTATYYMDTLNCSLSQSTAPDNANGVGKPLSFIEHLPIAVSSI